VTASGSESSRVPRVGILLPSTDTGVEVELPRRLDGAASLHPARVPLAAVTRAALLRFSEDALAQAALLRDVSPDLGVFGCTSGTFLLGAEHEQDLVRRLEGVIGAPVLTVARSMTDALRRRGTRVRLVASYTADIVDAEAEYLRAAGLDVTSTIALGVTRDEETAALTAADLLTAVTREPGPVDADVVMLSCTNLRTITAARVIEERIGLPVVSSNSALAEAILGRLRTGR
jgi:maleate isomerase